MLSIDDIPTVKHAIVKRLDAEPGIVSVHTEFQRRPYGLAVILEINLGNYGDKCVIVKSQFDLPELFEHAHVIDEIDQIAEHVKLARRTAFAVQPGERIEMKGTGRRGLWRRYGLRYV